MGKYNFVHLHNHTDYSLLDGMLKIKEAVEKAKNLGMNALAITDHGNLFGVIEFYKECVDKKIKPIIGSEFYYTTGSRFEKDKDRYHLILLAKNEIGYKNLIHLSSKSFLEGFYYKPRIDFDLLQKHKDGLICLSACMQGEVPSLILDGKFEEAEKKANIFNELFGKGNYFLEIQYHKLKEQAKIIKDLRRISVKNKIPLVATNDIHYLSKNDYEAHEVLMCIGTKKVITDQDRLTFPTNEFYFKTEEEMEKIFGEIPSSLKNTALIAEMCNLKLNLPGPILPDFQVPEGFTKETYLRKITEEGIYKRYKNVTKEIIDRMNMELEIINKMKFPGYFLIVWDFIKYARDNNIWVGPGRGSGAGSIVAYALGITNIDPLKYDLLFERFLNPERISMPDFDIDFCKERREEVIEYVNRKYGREKVSQIVTFGKMKAKMVVRDVGRVLGVPLARVNQIAKVIPDEGKNLKEKLNLSPEFKEIFEKGNEEEKNLIKIAEKLENLNRQTGVHACGVVIGQEPIINYVPMQVVKDEKLGDSVTTQFPGPQLEECGLVKMDFLGLITLTLMRNCVEELARDGIKVDLDNINLEDPKVYELFSNGDTLAIFQFESPGMQKYLKALKPNRLTDLIAMNALYRPGPLQYIESFIRRKNGEEKIEYDHPCLEPILGETYGIMVYQEQVMKVSQVMAGYSLGSADILRRAMGKKKAEEMAKQLVLFVDGAVKKGIDKEIAETVFRKMEKFAEYGFNKSHAAAYSYLAYQSAYLKAYYPVYFMASVLSSEIGNPDKLAKYVFYCKEKNIEILPPDINKSDVKFKVENGKIRYALNGIKGVGEAASRAIIEARNSIGNFKSFIDFLKNVDLRVINRSVLEILIKVGAFDSLGEKRKWCFENLDRLVENAQSYQNDKKIGQFSLFGNIEDEFAIKDISPENFTEWDKSFIFAEEKNILGFYVSGHPLDKYKNIISKFTNYNSSTLQNIIVHNNQFKKGIATIGIVKSVKVIKNENKESWAKIIVEDMKGSYEVISYSSTFKKYGAMFIENKILFFKLVVKKFNDKLQFICDEVQDIKEKVDNEVSEFHIYVKDGIEIDINELKLLRNDLLILSGGSLKIFFHLKNNNNDEIIIGTKDYLAPKDEEIAKVFMEKYSFIKEIKML